MIGLRQRGVRHRMILAWPALAWTFVAAETLLILSLSVWIPAPGSSSHPPWYYADTRAAMVGEPGLHPGAARPLTRINVLVALGLWVAARAPRRPGGGGVPVIAAARRQLPRARARRADLDPAGAAGARTLTASTSLHSPFSRWEIKMRRSSHLTVSVALLATLATTPVTAGESNADATPTWAADVAPIVHRSCASCHRPGEIAPMALLTYQEARPWAKSIRRAVSERAMPPWHADSSQVAYANDRSLSEEEIAILVRWVDAGAPAGDLDAAPAPPTFTAGWRLGEPDLVFTVAQPFRVPVTDQEIPYQSLVFAVDVPEDLYVAAWEIRTDAPQAVHHANLVRQPVPFEGGVGIAGAVTKGGDYIGSYLPGHNWVRYPEGTAYKLAEGSHLGIQVHYVSVGEEVEDTLQFGVHLADGRVDQLVRVIGTDYRAIEIPPGEEHYEIVDEITVLYDLLALSSGIHMHLRGAAYTMEAVRPDGEVQLITDVPRYDFNWQSNYVLTEPVPMPKGTRLRVTSVWDNSAENPYNPDPTATVRYGPWTEDEMVNSWAHVVLASERLGLLLEDGRVVGRADDAQETPHPFMIQTLPQAPSFQGVPGAEPSADERR